MLASHYIFSFLFFILQTLTFSQISAVKIEKGIQVYKRFLYKFFYAGCDAFCIKTELVKKLSGCTGLAEYILYPDLFKSCNTCLRKDICYCAA